MIDFGYTGTIQKHTIDGNLWIQIFPNWRNKSTMRDMLKILDKHLDDVGKKRTMLVQSERSEKKGLPVPCVMIKDKEE
tara:strand:- start:781 stop:1014 length:234 start_codon:yes stop_codon:yes gene_type:complete